MLREFSAHRAIKNVAGTEIVELVAGYNIEEWTFGIGLHYHSLSDHRICVEFLCFRFELGWDMSIGSTGT